MDASTLFQQLTQGTSIRKPPVFTKSVDHDVFALNESVVPTESSRKSRKSSSKPSKKIKQEEPMDDETISSIRSSLQINIDDPHTPAPLLSFNDLSTYSLPSSIISSLTDRFCHPTPIQRQVIPCICEKRDVLGLAPTGSGKTIAYLAPILGKILAKPKSKAKGLRVLILVPTAELASQVFNEACLLAPMLNIKQLNKKTVKASASSKSLSCHVLISTPLYLIQVLEVIPELLVNLKFLVIDEVDKLLDNRFVQQFDAIMNGIGASCRKSLFSATLHNKLSVFVRNILTCDPVNVTIGQKNASSSRVSQAVSYCGSEKGKLFSLGQVLSGQPIFTNQSNPVLAEFDKLTPPILIFVESKDKARKLYKDVLLLNICDSVEVIHADRSKKAREEALQRFRSGISWVLICTDLAARGLDLKSVNLVINFDIPGPIDYVHRIGRVGRGISRGKALTLMTDDDVAKARFISDIVVNSGGYVPPFLEKKSS
ncbi:hypothetical protein P9112_003832 [Eukaryota sp. TZLM1-RC]